jgi:hypothetical protein
MLVSLYLHGIRTAAGAARQATAAQPAEPRILTHCCVREAGSTALYCAFNASPSPTGSMSQRDAPWRLHRSPRFGSRHSERCCTARTLVTP